MSDTREDFPPRWQDLWARVQADEELHDWTVRPVPSTDGLAMQCKRILLGTKLHASRTATDVCRLLLHEAAHAIDPDDPPPGHSVRWMHDYLRLLCTYLDRTPPNQSDLIAFGVQQGWPARSIADLKAEARANPGDGA